MLEKIIFFLILVIGVAYVALAFFASKKRDDKFLDLSFWWPFSTAHCQGGAKAICWYGKILILVDIILAIIFYIVSH